MSNFNLSSEIDNLPINPIIISKLKKANLCSSKEILNLSLPELQRTTKLSAFEANIVLQAVSLAELKSSEVDACSLLNSSKQEYLNFEYFSYKFGRIYPGTITEICGESGSGKTQLCLFLSICAILPKYLGEQVSNVIYLHSEGEFPIQRFNNISETFKRKNKEYEKIKFMDNLMLKKVYNLKETIRVLQKGIPELLQKKFTPKVIIIDSVAALLRGEYDTLNDRNTMIQQLAVELWKLAHVFKMVVICVNQVSGTLQKSIGTSSSISTDIPSLGLLWANILTTRIKIYRRGNRDESVLRAFEVIFSAYHPRLTVNFGISEEGVETLSEYLI